MKKLLQIIIFLVCPLLINAQLTGDGTYTNPWSGTLSGNATWIGTKYINGDIIVDNEKLTINPGSLIIFIAEGSDLIITGTGQLEAVGTENDTIRFTADDDNDGNYGENGERWGHISFEAMGSAGSSIIDFCIIEYGYKWTTFSEINSKGGGIHTEFTDLFISNSIIRNNYAGWGGGLFIAINCSPNIKNCHIHSNTSYNSGGGIYINSGSMALLINCVIDKNKSVVGGGGGGLFLGPDCGNAKVINSVIVDNHANVSGKNIRFYKNTLPDKPSFINCIIWNPENSISYTSPQIPSSSDFINCAIQNPISGGTTNCISLNSVNNNPSGPNFIASDGSDWSISLNSPCRDAGTVPSPDVPTDFLGNSRIGPYDIGAYEVQYSRWKTAASTTNWNTGDNWDGGVPSLNRDVIIPTGSSLYPTATPGPDFTVGSGKQMIIEPGARVTLSDLTNDGTLKMNANASGLSSLILNSYTKGAGATEEIQLRITGGYVGDPEYNQGKWHFISSPVQYFPIDPIFTTTTYNLAQWIDGIQGAGSIREGWVAYDGYMYITGGFNSAYEFSDLTPGKGYNLWYDNDTIYSLSGILNTGAVNVTLDFAGDTAVNGYNLLGNPFPSGLDWDYIVENTTYPDSTSQGIAFNKDGQHYYYIAGVMVPDNGETPSGVIPPMQGFFVKTYAENKVINLTTDARSHDDIWPRFKGTSEIPLLRLSISEDEFSDETVVRFAEKAKTGLDYSYDAIKMFIPDNRPALYTLAGNYKFSINGQPFLEPESLIEIPLSVKVNSDGNHTITLKSIQALDDYDIYLIDKTTGFEADLGSTSSLSFSSAAGSINNRFIIRISNITTNIENPKTRDNPFNIYNGFGLINIQTLSDDWDGKTGSVKVLDMSGKIVTDNRNTLFSKTSFIQVREPETNGLYFIEIRSGLKKYVGKVVIW